MQRHKIRKKFNRLKKINWHTDLTFLRCPRSVYGKMDKNGVTIPYLGLFNPPDNILGMVRDIFTGEARTRPVE